MPYGIGMIHQHFKLVDVLTAAENIVLGLKDEGKLDIRRPRRRRSRPSVKNTALTSTPIRKIYDMSVSQKQTVEIVKVLYRGADILILDEPTAVLTPQETDRLFARPAQHEAPTARPSSSSPTSSTRCMAVSDQVAVLRKGKYIGTVKTSETNPQALTDMMVGRSCHPEHRPPRVRRTRRPA